MPTVTRFLLLCVAFYVWASCANPSEPPVLLLRKECNGYHCAVRSVVPGPTHQERWVISWTSAFIAQGPDTVYAGKHMDQVFTVKDSLTVPMDFTLAAKTVFMVWVTARGLRDSVFFDFTPR